MNRRAAVRLLCQGGGTVLLAGCEGLDLSAEGEGTGIQVVTALTILAKYRANQTQRAAAEQAARRAFVALAMKPAMQKESRELHRKIAAAPPATPAAPAPPVGGAISKVETKAVDEAAFAAAWKNTADSYQKFGDPGRGEVAMPASKGGIAFAPLSSRQILTASSAHAPNYLAVSVPRQGIPTESGAAEVVMLWDARRRQLAGDTAYAIKERPKEGRKVKIDGVAAVYVGQPAPGGL
jgi:hypothetical protein